MLDVILSKIKEIGFVVNSVKGQMSLQQIAHLGMQLGTDEHRSDAQSVKLIGKLPAPQHISALRSFLGLTGFSRNFIEGYAEIDKPLYLLLWKGREWI